MKVFDQYAQYYDALYQDKDYQSEVDYLQKAITEFSAIPVKRILNLGSGTGNHDGLLSKAGYQLTGVDLSDDMIEIAKEKATQGKYQVDYHLGDLRSVRLEQKFDAVLSLFAVMGYQIENHDVSQALATVKHHLKPGGIFVCDLWFGPAVLTQKPSVKTKTAPFQDGEVVRKTTPQLDIIRQLVEVNFETHFEKDNKSIDQTTETHLMRYFFYQELSYFVEMAGLELVGIHPFLKTNGTPTLDDWNIMLIARQPL